MARHLIPNKQDVQDNLNKLQLGMDEVEWANELQDSEAHHSNGMRLLKEVREWLIGVRLDC